jgi:hypothetical protein
MTGHRLSHKQLTDVGQDPVGEGVKKGEIQSSAPEDNEARRQVLPWPVSITESPR